MNYNHRFIEMKLRHYKSKDPEKPKSKWLLLTGFIIICLLILFLIL
jgi:hypothetical protein